MDAGLDVWFWSWGKACLLQRIDEEGEFATNTFAWQPASACSDAVDLEQVSTKSTVQSRKILSEQPSLRLIETASDTNLGEAKGCRVKRQLT